MAAEKLYQLEGQVSCRTMVLPAYLRYDNLQGLGEKKMTMIRHKWSHPGMCGRETNGEKSWRENKEERGKERKMEWEAKCEK